MKDSILSLFSQGLFLILVDAEVGGEDDGHSGEPTARLPAQRYGKVAQESKRQRSQDELGGQHSQQPLFEHGSRFRI
ncbi:hypothetical protein CEE39_08585 [bacterium (candidate division B38) B3_B38]|nr:MAG: hypothetical protein CEE39_08585 [bacterium (candidate division B38) B3_B38]